MKLTIRLDDPRLSSDDIRYAANKLVDELPKLNPAISTEFAVSSEAKPTAKAVVALHHVVEIVIQAGQVAGALKSIYEFLKVAFPEGLEGTIDTDTGVTTHETEHKNITESIKELNSHST